MCNIAYNLEKAIYKTCRLWYHGHYRWNDMANSRLPCRNRYNPFLKGYLWNEDQTKQIWIYTRMDLHKHQNHSNSGVFEVNDVVDLINQSGTWTLLTTAVVSYLDNNCWWWFRQLVMMLQRWYCFKNYYNGLCIRNIKVRWQDY